MAAVTHSVAEERSLALHREVARRLGEAPELLEAARRRVSLWLASGAVQRRWALRWDEILKGPVCEVVAAITDPNEEAKALRQVSPFAGAIDPRTRWAILRQVRGEAVLP